MDYNFSKDVRLFMIFDILGDTERTGPILWQINRRGPLIWEEYTQRLEDVKNHVVYLMFFLRILRKHFPSYLNFELMFDYILFHDLPEAVTGDITKFEGVTNEEITRVTNIVITFLTDTFRNVIDFEKILNGYEEKIDIEAKVVNMLDKLHSVTTFIKYQCEQNVDMNDPRIISELRNHPFVAKEIAEGKDIADIFFEFHSRAINITDEECRKYNISRADADLIVNAIRAFAAEIYEQKLNGTLFINRAYFPKQATIYNRNMMPYKK